MKLSYHFSRIFKTNCLTLFFRSSSSRSSSRLQGCQTRTESLDDDIYGKSFVLSPGRKSLSMSNIVQEHQGSSWMHSRRRSSLKSELKSFLSAKNLTDMQISLHATTTNKSAIQSHSRDSLCYNPDKIDKLLDDISDGDDQNYQPDNSSSKVMVEVEDLLQMAIEERRGKIEAKTCLAELQMKHDELQKKYAAAEITIDNMRYILSHHFSIGLMLLTFPLFQIWRWY